MKGDWFRIGLFLWLLSLLPSPAGKVLLASGGGIWLVRRGKKGAAAVFLAASCWIAASSLAPVPSRPEGVFRGCVSDIRKNYFLVEGDGQTVLVVSQEGVNFADEVEIEGSFRLISGPRNRAGSTFRQAMEEKDVYYASYQPDVHILRRHRTLRARVYSAVCQKSGQEQEVLKMFLFRQRPDDFPSFVLLSCGMHLSALFRLIEQVLGFWMEEKARRRGSTLIKVFFGFFFGWERAMVRILIRDLCRYTGYCAHDRWGMFALCLCVLYPSSARSMSCFLPILLSLAGCTIQQGRKLAFPFCVGLAQLFLNGYCDVGEIILTMLWRPVFTLSFLLCLADIWLPAGALLKMLPEISRWIAQWRIFPSLRWIGSPSAPVLFLILALASSASARPRGKNIAALCAVLLAVRLQNALFPLPRVTFLDVGQGDSALVQLPFGRGNFLIDTGGLRSMDIAGDVLLPVLSSYGIGRLDAVFLSHADEDHDGAFAELKGLIPIRQVHREKEEEVRVGDCRILDPLWNHAYEEENAGSLLQYFDLMGTKFLFTGDIPKTTEYDLRKEYSFLPADILKLPHHGSSTSSSRELLDLCRPSLALISSGRGNPYHHPSLETVQRLQENRIPFLNTAEEGAVEILCFPGGYVVRAQSGRAAFCFRKEKALAWLDETCAHFEGIMVP